ncbi:4-hydroxy-tetrahydrodipicolinate synthase [Salinibacter ruber]|uniref:4-hydroxy-tetrahydrodipicolinate synthase n=1 Tax=Salinibacter ruber TaxID=146919 RepID=A0A9X2ZPF0_9BACT|nr:4-hydroxy-tetrahydrodipicolinate synthase [Salinibacter ruber]MCS3859884.1 4-hydroxy-tetrahydrodipicolinate synthase [Salinibacter ruber]MCS3866712.1 4-hydroxy-tetrahydrodipicolinate synthase [Salinibacter ruber]MCS4152544.1 4-hydroxy-tetrahydrodipicolinate synthase [Salinibacter ruber]
MAHDMLFRGVAPALVTPFTSDDDIDEAAFRRLIDAQIEGGVSALVVLGTTGENPTITEDERRRIVDAALDAADGRVPVIVGTGTNNTDKSVAFSKAAVDAGADGLLVVGPYYNKPSQAGFAAHVETIAAAAEAPIILYNVPGRTSFNIAPETALHLAEEVPHVAGIKEASGDIEQIDDLLAHRPDGFGVYSGDDEMTLPLLAMGGDGAVSVISNALPGPFCELVAAGLDDDLATARDRHAELLPAMRACFLETNPVPIKDVCAALGWMEPHVRLPLTPMDERSPVRQRVLSAFDDLIDVTVA